MPASRADLSGHRQNGVHLFHSSLNGYWRIQYLALCLLGVSCSTSLHGANVSVTIEFSDHTSRTYTLSKNGEFRSGLETMGYLINSLGGGLQFLDDPDWTRNTSSATPWIQWWRYSFGLALYGLGLGTQQDSGFDSGYWALYTATAGNDPWSYAEVGLADLIPIDGFRIGLKYSTYDDLTGPSESQSTQILTVPAPPTAEPPRLVSLTTIDSDRFSMTFATTPGCRYQLEMTESLSIVEWEPWSGIWVATSNETTLTTQIKKNKPTCFYRLRFLQ